MKASIKVVTTSNSKVNSANKLAGEIRDSIPDTAEEAVVDVIPGASVDTEDVSVDKGSSVTSSPPDTSSSSICEYDGTYTLKPLYKPCSSAYFSYDYSCKRSKIKFRKTKQVKKGKSSIDWTIESKNGISTIIGKNRSSCKAFALAAPSKVSKGLNAGGKAWKWKIEPRKSSDCSKVNLYSTNQKRYLAVDTKKCSSLSYTEDKNTKPTLFRITKRKS